jgi:hypothetical protein
LGSRKIGAVGDQPGQIIQETLSQKYSTQKRAGRVAQVVECLSHKCESPEFNTVPPPQKKSWYQFRTIVLQNSSGVKGRREV